MNSKYKVLKYSSKKFENIDDLISIEEPLEISLKYKETDKWINQSLSITMRTPGDDEDLVRGFLYNEQIITNIGDIKKFINVGEQLFEDAKVSMEKHWKDFKEILDKKNLSRKECLLLPLRTIAKALKI